MMLTTTVDGLWVLQVLTGIEVIAPELGLRPHLPSAEDPALALAHPVAEELRAAGAIDHRDRVDDPICEWLTVLSRRDVALHVQVTTPGATGPERIALSRFARWWVTLERCDALLRVSEAGTAPTEQAASRLISAELDRLCGTPAPASLRPVSLDAAALVGAVRNGLSCSDFLKAQRLDANQIALLAAAADPARSTQISIVALQASAAVQRPQIDSGTVTIIDTPAGRLVSEHLRRDRREWMVVSPGSPTNIASAICTMLRRLPANDEWFSYRKVV